MPAAYAGGDSAPGSDARRYCRVPECFLGAGDCALRNNPMTSTDSLPSKISVYIPAYNVADYLPRCLEALFAQTLPPDEILVIDDGSRDASAEIASKYPSVALIHHGTNKGLGAARNTATRAARNELVASL